MSKYDINRKVGGESRKTYKDKIENHFFEKFLKGNGLDIGYSGYEKDIKPILETASGIDFNTKNYDGLNLFFDNNSQDYVYSSHCLEHIINRAEVIREWFRVVKKGGYIVTVVPHRDIYEKKLTLPSRWNQDHKIFYTPAILLKEFEDALPINSFRVRHLQDNDRGHDYSLTVDTHSPGEYEIEVVIQKL